jgi:hypothetical protein
LTLSKLTTLEEASRQASNSLHAEQDCLLEEFPKDIANVTATIDESDPRMYIYKLASRPNNLAALCDSLEQRKKTATSTIKALQSAPAFQTSSCPCRRHQSHRTKHSFWLSWHFWDSETVYFNHYEGCKYFRSNGDERSRAQSLRLTGFVKTAIIVTFYTRTGAGGHSLGANLEYYATVDEETSPTFCVLSVLQNCAAMLRTQGTCIRQSDNLAQWERLILVAIQKLDSLFMRGKAGAKDVSSLNQSLLHAAAHLVSNEAVFGQIQSI